jgi:hypothetical protein
MDKSVALWLLVTIVPMAVIIARARRGEARRTKAHVALAPSGDRSARAAAQTDSAGAPAAAPGGGSPGASVWESKRISSASPCALNRACWHARGGAVNDGKEQ